MREPDGFREFVTDRSPALLRTAWMLTGDAHRAEDLLQTALTRTWPHWSRIREQHPEAYVRKVMVRTNASWWSRRWRGERPTEDLTAAAARSGDASSTRAEAADPQQGIPERIDLARALRALPVRQRQCVVLRHFDDLSVAETARLMGCSEGTVKSQTAKGLASLRTAIEREEREEKVR
ncbi:putative RNA polymerase ECF-subfamily sigma factor [Serinicoccus hydrothermalis]|uniref:Putative RNA polymerase ECF-subfamily sigma factor n=1 Tax=Serinicoccus hydrothermalis TaxID=1758689 RepID=A0A1B1NAU0_9MICO|nr:putative RNA polymerase ECF-subfamily sigma factor [Serinicoccus hydrothermalis]